MGLFFFVCFFFGWFPVKWCILRHNHTHLTPTLRAHISSTIVCFSFCSHPSQSRSMFPNFSDNANDRPSRQCCFHSPRACFLTYATPYSYNLLCPDLPQSDSSQRAQLDVSKFDWNVFALTIMLRHLAVLAYTSRQGGGDGHYATRSKGV